MKRVVLFICLAAELAAAAALVALFLWVLAGIVAREAFGYGLPHLLDFSAALMVAIAFLGLGRATWRRENLTFDWVVKAVKHKWARRGVVLFADLVSAAVLALWTYAAVLNALDAFADESGPRFGAALVTWPAKTASAIGLVIAVLVMLAHLGQTLRDQDEPGPEAGRGLLNRTSGERDASQPQVRDQTGLSVPNVTNTLNSGEAGQT